MIFSLLLLCAIPLGYELRAVEQENDYSMVEIDPADILRIKRKFDFNKKDDESNFKNQRSSRQKRKPENSELDNVDVQEALSEIISSDITKSPQKKKVKKAVKEMSKEALSEIIIPEETKFPSSKIARKAIEETPNEKQSQPNQKLLNKSIQQEKRELKSDKMTEITAAPRKSRSNKQISKVIEDLFNENYGVQYDVIFIEEPEPKKHQKKARSIIQKKESDKNTFLGQEDYNEEIAVVPLTETRKSRGVNQTSDGSDIKTEKYKTQKPTNAKQEPPKRSLYDKDEGYAIDEIYEEEGEKIKSQEIQPKQRKSRNSNKKKKQSEPQNQDYYDRELEK